MSWQTEARIPGILLAAIHAPTPVPQTKMPRAAEPLRTRSQTRFAMSGKSTGAGSYDPQSSTVCPLGAQVLHNRAFQREARVITSDGQRKRRHMILPISRRARRGPAKAAQDPYRSDASPSRLPPEIRAA